MVDWEAWERIGLIIDASSGGLFVLLGLFVAFVKPRTRLSLAFATFALAFGGAFLISNALNMSTAAADPSASTYVLYAVLDALTIGALAVVIRRFPERLPNTASWPVRQVGWILLAIVAAETVWVLPWHDMYRAETGSAPFLLVAVRRGVETGSDLALTFLLIVLAYRWSLAPPDGRRPILLVSAGLGLYQMWSVGSATLGAVGESLVFIDNDVLRVVSTITGASMWLVAAARARGDHRRTARRVAWLFFALMAAGALFRAIIPSGVPANNLGIHGILRTIGVFILAYSILKHQLFDIDVKLKFGIKQSTVVAIVIAVFVGVQTFVSEYFTDSAGLWAGAVAMGVMVLAIRPLQSLGQKVADRAMPNVRPLTERSDDERVEMYRRLAESAWSDGALSRAEGRVLETAREQLGLTAEQALEVEAAMRG